MHAILTSLTTALLMTASVPAFAKAWYVDASVASNGDGKSWSTAWKNVTEVTGVAAGDTVYISGGTTGSTTTYEFSAPWAAPEGMVANPVVYQIGQDAMHNGTAIFATTGANNLLGDDVTGITFSGDAGDGAKHFQLGGRGTGGVINASDGCKGLHFAYIDCGSRPHQMFGFRYYGGANEVDHCYAKSTANEKSSSLFWVFAQEGATFAADTFVVHDNEFHVEYDPRHDGWGDDCFAGQYWSGLTIKGNKVVADARAGFDQISDQHGDGCQPLQGNNFTIDGNLFINFPNYAVFIDGNKGGFSHVRVINNVTCLTDAHIQAFNSPLGFSIIDQTGVSGTTYNDVVVDNNLAADYGGRYAVHWDLYPSQSDPGLRSVVTNCRCYHNISVNSGGFNLDRRVASGNNVAATMVTGSGHFVRYTRNHGDVADFRLVPEDTLFKGSNRDKSPRLTNDRERPAR